MSDDTRQDPAASPPSPSQAAGDSGDTPQAGTDGDTAAAGADTDVDDADAGFDALGAAAELDAALAADEPSEPVEPVGESYTDILESEVAELSALLAEKDSALVAAEVEREKARARLEADAERQLERRTRKLLNAFLEILDDLDRALGAARETDHNPAVIDGIELVRNRFIQQLGAFGVVHHPAMGEVFDPNLHDAISTMPVQTPEQHGRVVAVVREGYLIGEDTLRPAGVVVGKNHPG